MFIQIGLGLYVDDLPVSLNRLRWVARHKSVGMLILTLFLLRLAWRSIDRAPALPDAIAPMERGLARSAHRLLYALAILAALTGWLHASAAGLGASFFGLFPVPSLISKDVELSDLFKAAHNWLVWSLVAVLALHVAAAARHLWLRDGIVGRMTPWQPAGIRPRTSADDTREPSP